ncbi:MAG: nucleotide sugar dehydrogenase [Bryobacteraceae bacterium]|jgi:UDPglucose 6-dehydrogenase|nr:nucleotide sugar dehydrogenase [Bryobacteraceae bacterium]
MKIAVVGLGKLGAVMAAVLAERGHTVTGADRNGSVVDKVNQGRAPVAEPGLEELLRRNRERLRATPDTEMAVAGADVVFIVTPTPSGPDGMFSVHLVLEASEAIGRALRNATGFPVVAVTSTVMPGHTGGRILPLLESVSGKRCGVDFGLCYNPEFIALGSVIRDFMNPDMILIGESDARSGQILEELYRGVCTNRPAVARMNFVNAELTKLCVNTFVTTKISYANMLAEVCERLPDADAGVVTQALGLDSRIGPKYLKGALGYGGPCFPRDNAAFAAMARALGVEPALPEATDRVNRRQVHRVADLILRLLPPGGTAGMLGLAYKPDTNVVEESQGMLIAQCLAERGVPVIAYDPAAMEAARRVLDSRVRLCSSMEECAQGADVLVIATPWEAFRGLGPEHLNCRTGQPIVLDCWRLLSPERFEGRALWVTLGRGPGGEAVACSAVN